MRTYSQLLLFLFVAGTRVSFASLPDSTADRSVVAVSGLDSVRSYAIGEIIVTALRLPEGSLRSASPITVLSRDQLDILNSTSLADLLAPLPGVFIKNYGGTSGLKTISQRGLGAEHTLVLINGMRVSNPLTGLVDLGLLEEDQVERLEFVRGGQSASYGADAVAGLVNAVLNPVLPHERVRAAASVGSFGYRKYMIAAGGPLGNAATLAGSYREEKGLEDFPFVFRNGNERFDLVRKNSDFSSRTGVLHAAVRVGEEIRASLFGRTYTAERGVGGPVVGPASISVARQKDEDNILQFMVRMYESARLSYKLGFQFHQAFERYEDRSFIVGASWLNNYYRIADVRVEPGLEYRIGEATRIGFGGEFARTSAGGNGLKANVLRFSYAGYGTMQYRVRVEHVLVKDLIILPALRYDLVRTEGTLLTSWSPQLGIVCSLQELVDGMQAALKTSISRNFRAPTFNELYYGGGGGVGNPKLQPERSTSFDVGAELTYAYAGMHQVQCTYFDVDMWNRIVWTSAGTMMVTPKNLRRVRSNGVELSYHWSVFNRVLTFGVNYTLLRARKTEADYPGDPTANNVLIYVPQETAHYAVGIRLPVDGVWLREMGGAVTLSRTGYRYVTEDNQRFLPSYTRVDANVHTTINISDVLLKARLEINNVFNEEYQSVPSYPMPLRSFRFSLGMEL